MEKGTRVVVVGGRKAKGVTGTVFWTGPDSYGDGLRIGLRGDDGETHWLNADQVKALEEGEDPGPSEAPTVQKGAIVSFTTEGEAYEGEVFWVGENKYGPGQRLGVRDPSGETHWLDAMRVTVLEASSQPAPPSDSGGGPPQPPPPTEEPPPMDAQEMPPPYDYDGE